MIGVEHDGPVACVTLKRPDQRNALTPEMLDALADAARATPASGARALLLAGEGRVFCAGFDLTLCRESPDGSAMRALLTGLSGAIIAMRDLPIPVVLACHGAAIAGGCALLGGADVVVADRGAKLGYPVVRLGVSPAVSAPFLRTAVGDGACRTRLLDTDLIDGVRAHEVGLVHELVGSREEVLPRALRVARALAGKPAWAVAATKRWCNELAPTNGAQRALGVSLSLTGGEEEQTLLRHVWGDDS